MFEDVAAVYQIFQTNFRLSVAKYLIDGTIHSENEMSAALEDTVRLDVQTFQQLRAILRPVGHPEIHLLLHLVFSRTSQNG